MENTLKEINLLQRLIQRVNCEFVDLNYTLLADYFIRHFDQLESLTIEKICEDNFISKSTLTRFCKHIGYENLTELKKAKNTFIVHHEHIQHFNLAEELNKLNIRTFDIQYIIKEMQTHEKVFILYPNNLLAAAFDFQQRLLQFNQIVYLVPNIDQQYHLINHFLVDSCVIILDSNLEYTSSLLKYIQQIKSRLILISNYQANLTLLQEKAFHIQICDGCENELIAKYQYMFYLDQIILSYQNV